MSRTASLTNRPQPCRPSPDELEIIALREQQHARLLLAIVESIGGRVFHARKLRRYATTVNPALREALERAGLHTSRAIGKRLQLLAGHVYRGLVVKRIPRDSAGTWWEVQVMPDLHQDTRLPGHDGV